MREGAAFRPRIKVASPSFSRHPDLRAEALARFPNTVFHESGERLSGAALAAFLADAQGAVIGLERIDAALLDRCPDLRIVAKYGVGLDNVDMPACEARAIALGWTGGINRRSVAELTLCLMLGLCRNVFRSSTQLRHGLWEKDGGTQLSGKTVGIVGLGCVGRDVARLLEPFHCRVLANDIGPIDQYCADHGLVPASKDAIFAEADVITLHVPATCSTRHLINRASLNRMKRGAAIINTSRGDVVDQAALKQALIDRSIAAAALDVFAPEPPDDLEFLALPNLVATAHIGGSAAEAILALGRSAIGHLDRFFASRHAGPEARPGNWIDRPERVAPDRDSTPCRGAMDDADIPARVQAAL
jgi:phosphoglycerate dehydrogenase-like enzyme